MNIKQIFTIPNILSVIRILMIPVFVKVYMGAETVEAFYLAAGILFLSGLTDAADGYIARKYNMISDLGKIIDPMADKLTQISVAICLALRIEGMGFLLSLFIIKEVLMIIGSALLLGKGIKLDGAKWFGKVATAVFYLVMFLIVAVPTLDPVYINLLIIASALTMIFSFIMYIPEFIAHLKKNK